MFLKYPSVIETHLLRMAAARACACTHVQKSLSETECVVRVPPRSLFTLKYDT